MGVGVRMRGTQVLSLLAHRQWGWEGLGGSQYSMCRLSPWRKELCYTKPAHPLPLILLGSHAFIYLLRTCVGSRLPAGKF